VTEKFGKVQRATLAALALASSLLALGFAPEKSLGPDNLNSALDSNGEFGLRTNYKNWGLINSQAKSHIDAPDAWKIEEGSSNIIVGVIDTGIDPNHPSLKKNIWHSGESDEYGRNFVTNSPNPMDEHGHGTHVAGIIGAMADPRTGVSGVAHHVSIMSVKYYSDANPGSVNLKNTVKAINYAIDHGARIINYSGGGPEFSEDEYLAIKRAESKGILFVAAAGNEHQNTDLSQNYYYPSAYRLSNILSVAATDIHNNLLATSNWGKKRVDVAAPGENIFSTLPGGRYGYMSGTSQATAFVTGIAALLLSHDPSLTPVQLKEIIMSSVDRFPQLETKLVTGGRVNAYSALLALKNGNRFKTQPILADNPFDGLTRTPGSGELVGPMAPAGVLESRLTEAPQTH
jgi:subtilisin family serine protease